MKHIYTILCILGLLTSCNIIQENLPEGMLSLSQDSVQVNVLNTKVLDNGNKLRVGIDVVASGHKFDLGDSARIETRIDEVMYPFSDIPSSAEPKLDSIVNVAVRIIQEKNLGMLVMVDLSQNREIIKAQQQYVAKMFTQYAKQNLFVSFMLPGGDVTPIIEVTPYIINTYISTSSPYLQNNKKTDAPNSENAEDSIVTIQKDYPYLLRSLRTNLVRLLSAKTNTQLDNMVRKVFVVLTDGVVYQGSGNIPVDPDHFTIEQELLEASAEFGKNMRLYVVNISEKTDEEEGEEEEGLDDSESLENHLLQILAGRSKGAVIDNLDWFSLSDRICSSFGFQLTDYQLYFKQPENKIFMGNKRVINISFVNREDSTTLKGQIPYETGSIYNPVLIGTSVSFRTIALQSFVIGLIVLMFTYLIMQFAVPYGLYLRFRKLFVIYYKGPNMTYKGSSIATTCYYCKAPFVPGDKIVAKCSHVMHEECWNENGNQCTEYGKRCPDGSHFYDKSNLLNPQNAPFYMKWVLCAILAATISWSYYVYVEQIHLYRFLDWILGNLFMEVGAGSTVSFIEQGTISPRLYNMPAIAFHATFVLTFLLSLLVVYTRKWYWRIADCLVRAIFVATIVISAFILECVLVVAIEVYDGMFLLDWLPWSLATIAVASSLIFRTRIKPRKEYLVYAAGIGAAASIGWSFIADVVTTNFYLLGIFVNMFFSVGVAILMAQQMPRHEHNVLHVTGPIKEMDIALYKWMNGTAHGRVTIGKSVDCDIHISWDIQSNIAPLQAELISENNRIRLIATDEGVLLSGKPLAVNKSKTLYHGDKFQIGLTVFQFIEE